MEPVEQYSPDEVAYSPYGVDLTVIREFAVILEEVGGKTDLAVLPIVRRTLEEERRHRERRQE